MGYLSVIDEREDVAPLLWETFYTVLGLAVLE